MALEWLSQFLQIFTDLVPRPLIVSVDESCVEFVLGKHARQLNPGYYIQWPFFAKYHHFYIMWQYVEESQRIDKNAYKWQITYEIENPLLYSVKTSDQGNIVKMEGRNVFSMFVDRFPDRNPKHRSSEKMIKNKLRKKLKNFGVKIIDFCVTDTCAADRTFSIWELSKQEQIFA